MDKRTYSLTGAIPIGHVGENESREVALDITQLTRTWPELEPVLVGRRPGEKDVYLCAARREGNTLVWTVTSGDTAIPGRGEIRVWMTDAQARTMGKSRIVQTVIGKGMEGEMDGAYPVAVEPWAQRILEEIGTIREGYVRTDQGAENAGMALVVGEDGRVTLGKGGAGGGVEFETDETLTLEDGVLSVNTAKSVEKDNTLPITSAAVFTEVGNINALLETI